MTTAKTTFRYATWFVALAVVIGSALAVPLSTADTAAVTAINSEGEKPSVVQPDVQEQLKSSADSPVVSDPSEGISVDPSLQQQQQQQQQQQFVSTDAVPAGSDQQLPETDPSLSAAAVNEKIDSDVPLPATVGLDNAGKQADTVGGTDSSPTTTVTGPVQSPDSSVVGSNPPPPKPVGYDQTPPKPYYPADKIGQSALPLFMQFFQPFSAFPPFAHNIRNQPFQHQYQLQPQFPFGAPIGSFDPFVNSMRTPSFNQLVNEYTNEFRKPKVIIIKPKRHVGINTTSIPPIPLLLNVMLNAFRHSPSDMLASLNKDMPQANSADDDGKEVANKPVAKTTSRTEIIDGHVVQINETTYSDGDANHKSFYHFKEIQVVPEGTDNKKIGNDNKGMTPPPPTATGPNDPETLKVNTNEIVPDMFVETFDVNDGEDKQNSFKKTREPVPLEDHYQMAASGRGYAPFVPYGPLYGPSLSAAPYYNGPPPPHSLLPVVSVIYNGPTPVRVAPVNYDDRPTPVRVAQANYNSRPLAQAASVNYNRPPTRAPPVSLHGDTRVNELMAAQHQASGTNAVLPPDVEIVDVNGKPQQMHGGQFYYNDHHNGPKKFPGSKY